MRNGKIPEALSDLETVWNYQGDRIPANIKRVHGTQYADALRRRVEQLFVLGNVSEAEKEAIHGMNVVDQAAAKFGVDSKLAEVGVELCDEIDGRSDVSQKSEMYVRGVAKRWGSDTGFEYAIRNIARRPALFGDRFEETKTGTLMATGKSELGTELLTRGIIKVVQTRFGFITTDSLGDVHMDQTSMARAGSWRRLFPGQRVVFLVERTGRGLHAINLDVDPEGQT